jgi:hypothetical protein
MILKASPFTQPLSLSPTTTKSYPRGLSDLVEHTGLVFAKASACGLVQPLLKGHGIITIINVQTTASTNCQVIYEITIHSNCSQWIFNPFVVVLVAILVPHETRFNFQLIALVLPDDTGRKLGNSAPRISNQHADLSCLRQPPKRSPTGVWGRQIQPTSCGGLLSFARWRPLANHKLRQHTLLYLHISLGLRCARSAL